MPIATTCPQCKAIFRLGDELAGRTVKCQKCGGTFVVPNPTVATSLPGVPVMNEEPDEASLAYTVPASAQKPPVVQAAPEDDEMAVEEEEDRDDDAAEGRAARRRPERDRPRRRSSRTRASAQAAGNGALVWVLAIGGLSLFLCVGCAGVGAIVWAVAGKNGARVAQPPPVAVVGKNGDRFEQPPPFPPGGINVTFGADNRFRQVNQLTLLDPITPEGSRHKMYMVHMQANRTYQIDMTSKQVDSYLVILDDNNMVVARDDDSGGGLDARIIFTPPRTGFFRVEAASCPPQINPQSPPTGPYTLAIERR